MQYSAELYARLEAETGLATGFRRAAASRRADRGADDAAEADGRERRAYGSTAR